MHISAPEEFGLRCMLRLARMPKGKKMAASEIAQLEGISVRYASKFLQILRRAGFLRSIRGTQGGFVLDREPQEINLLEVFDALMERENSPQDFCQQFAGKSGECVHAGDCSVRPVWQILDSYFRKTVANLTLGDLMQSEEHTRGQIQKFAQEQSVQLENRFYGAKKETANHAEY